MLLNKSVKLGVLAGDHGAEGGHVVRHGVQAVESVLLDRLGVPPKHLGRRKGANLGIAEAVVLGYPGDRLIQAQDWGRALRGRLVSPDGFDSLLLGVEGASAPIAFPASFPISFTLNVA